MATRLDRGRRAATASSVWLGDPKPAGPDYGPDSPHPITTRDIYTAGRWIGWLLHRDYDSGYPGRYEVVLLGGRSWSFHDDEQDALRATEEFATAYLRPGSHRLPAGRIELARLPTPVERDALASTPSLVRPWPKGPKGRRQIAQEVRLAAAQPSDDNHHRLLIAVAEYLAGDD